MSGDEIKPGDILVASPALGFDPDFGQSVIIILAHGHATVGINVASGHVTSNLFKGGPLRMPIPVVLHRAQDSIGTSRPVGDSGYSITEMDTYENANDLISKKPEKAVVAAGYAGWGPGQLQTEITQGVWKKAEGLSIEELLSTSHEQRWSLAAARAGMTPPALQKQPGTGFSAPGA